MHVALELQLPGESFPLRDRDMIACGEKRANAAQELRMGTSTAGTPNLTARELECLTWVSRGKTDQEIAQVLSVAPRTIRFHIDNAKTKLGVETRVQAVARLLRERPDLMK